MEDNEALLQMGKNPFFWLIASIILIPLIGMFPVDAVNAYIDLVKVVAPLLVAVYVVDRQVRKANFLKGKSETFIASMSVYFGERKANMAIYSDQEEIEFECKMYSNINKTPTILKVDDLIFLKKYIKEILSHRRKIGSGEMSQESLARLLLLDDGSLHEKIKNEYKKCQDFSFEKIFRAELAPNNAHYVSRLYKKHSMGDFESFNKDLKIWLDHSHKVMIDEHDGKKCSSPQEMRQKYKNTPREILEQLIQDRFPDTQ